MAITFVRRMGGIGSFTETQPLHPFIELAQMAQLGLQQRTSQAVSRLISRVHSRCTAQEPRSIMRVQVTRDRRQSFSGEMALCKLTVLSPGHITTGGGGVQDGSITVDSSGNLWVSEFETLPGNQIEVFKSSNLATNTWSNKLTITGLTNWPYATQMIALTSGKVALVYAMARTTGSSVSIKEWSGSAWGTTRNTVRSSLFMGYSSAVALGDTVEPATTNSTEIIYYSFAYGATAWAASVEIGKGSYAAMSTNGGTVLTLSYMNSTTIEYVSSSTSGSSWSEPVTVSSSETSAQFLSASFTIQSNNLLMCWTAGSRLTVQHQVCNCSLYHSFCRKQSSPLEPARTFPIRIVL